MRRIVLALAVLLGVVAAAPAWAGGRVEGVYLGSIMFGSSLDFKYCILFTDGRAFEGAPPGGPEAMDLAAAAVAEPKAVGKWTEAGGAVTIVWGGGRPASVYERRPDGSLNLHHGVSTRLAPLPDGQRLAGRYSRMAVAKGPGVFLTSSKSIEFRADGGYSGSGTGTASIAGVDARSSSQQDAGSYAVKGWSVELTHADRSTSRHFLATYAKEPPAGPEIIFFDGGYMMRK